MTALVLGLLTFACMTELIYTGSKSILRASTPGIFRHIREAQRESFHTNLLQVPTQKLRVGLRCLSFVLALGVFVLGWAVLGRPLLVIPVSLLGAVAPWFLWRLKVSRIREVFERQLGDALSLLSSSMRSGQSLPQALETLSRESQRPLKGELELVLNQYKLGRPMSIVLEAWSERVESSSLKFVVSAVSIAQVTGGSLAGILQGVAAMIRQGEQLKARARSLAAQGKLSGFVVGAMPFGLMAGIGILSPDLITPLFTTDLGNMLFLIVCILVGIGLYFIQRIVDVQV